MTGNTFKFWGTRGSSSVSGKAFRYFGGNTNCVEIHTDDQYIIIDAGTGIVPLGQMLENKKVRKIDLFLSHIHWDHVIGLPFFLPIYHPESEITIWAPFDSEKGRERLIDKLFSEDLFPVKPEQILGQISFRTLKPNFPIQLGSVIVDCHRTNHPGTTYGFKFKFCNSQNQTIGYVTDNEILKGFHGDLTEITSKDLKPYENFIDFFKGCDVLVHEAQYFPEEYLIKTGWGHSSVKNVIPLIQHAMPKRWLVTHHDPAHTDDDLFRLSNLAKQILRETHIDCTVEWVHDEYAITL